MYNITFPQIEAFLTIARCLNMSRAAESLYISQPTLSKSLQRFEKGIGYEVFIRSNQGVSLTPQGEYLYTALESLYNGMEKAINSAKEIANKENKIIRMIVPSSYDMVQDFDNVKKHIQDFEDLNPDIAVIPQLFDFKELRRQLEFGETDIAIAHEFVVEGIQGIECRKISKYPMHIVMAEDHPLTRSDVFDPSTLNGVVVFAVKQLDEDISKEGVRKQCGKIGFTPGKIELVDNIHTMLHMLKEKRGIAICGKFDYNPVQRLKSYPVDDLLGTTYIVAAWHTDKLSKQAKKFIKMLPFEE